MINLNQVTLVRYRVCKHFKWLWFSHITAKVNEKIYQNKENKSLKFIQTHFYFQNIYVAADLQQGIKLFAWCMANIEAIIKAHNNKILNKKKQRNKTCCNCADSCKNLLKGSNCRPENIVYKSAVTFELDKVLHSFVLN